MLAWTRSPFSTFMYRRTPPGRAASDGHVRGRGEHGHSAGGPDSSDRLVRGRRQQVQDGHVPGVSSREHPREVVPPPVRKTIVIF